MTTWTDQGWPSQWVTETEPEWDDDSRDRVLALIQLDGHRHGRCGHQLDRAIATDHGVRVHRELCQFCRAIKIAQDDYHEKHKDEHGKSDVHEHVWWAEEIPLP